MALNQGFLAQNVRRLAGLHLVSMEALAAYVGVSRQTMQSIVAYEPHHRSLPRADTAIKIANAFGVSLNALYSDPIECLREALEKFDQAPITAIVEPPGTDLAPGLTAFKKLADIRKARTARSRSERKAPK
jgi:DNA-binding XRE family transcriptional regulator